MSNVCSLNDGNIRNQITYIEFAIKNGKKRLGDLAEHFGVTAAAVKYRAYKLDLIK